MVECNPDSNDAALGQTPEIVGINERFFEKYGHPDDANSWLFNSKLLIVRHAQSTSNAE